MRLHALSRFRRHPLLPTVITLAAILGCSATSGSGPGSHVNVRIVNTAIDNATGVVDGPGFSPLNITLPLNVDYVDELPGVVGDMITVDVAAPGGLAGSISCRADATIVDTPGGGSGLYGQITVGNPDPGAPTVILLICSSGWQ